MRDESTDSSGALLHTVSRAAGPLVGTEVLTAAVTTTGP